MAEPTGPSPGGSRKKRRRANTHFQMTITTRVPLDGAPIAMPATRLGRPQIQTMAAISIFPAIDGLSPNETGVAFDPVTGP